MNNYSIESVKTEDIDEGGSFHHILVKDTASLTEVFRGQVIKLFVDRGPFDRGFAL